MDLHHCSHQQNFVTTSGGRFDRTRRSHEEGGISRPNGCDGCGEKVSPACDESVLDWQITIQAIYLSLYGM